MNYSTIFWVALLTCCWTLKQSKVEAYRKWEFPKDVCEEIENLPQVDIRRKCNKAINIEKAMSIVPTTHWYNILPDCMNCTLTLRSTSDLQLTLTFYSIAMEMPDDDHNDKCMKTKLDIYDGQGVSQKLLSDSSGICGCGLPRHTYQSSGSSLTLHLQTDCTHHTKYGQFDIVVGTVEKGGNTVVHCPGQFECGNGHCVESWQVCNKEDDCGDNSDEDRCQIRRNFPPGWVLVLVIVGIIILLILFVVMISSFAKYCCTNSYHRV